MEIVVDAAITNEKGKQKQDPRVPPPRKFPPPRGGQHPINIHVRNPAPDLDSESTEEDQEPICTGRIKKKKQEFFRLF